MNLELTKAMLERHEGSRNIPYQDSKGIWTVGVGHNMSGPLSAYVITRIFEEDMTVVIDELTDNFQWFPGLNDARQGALIDLAFNMGMPTLLTFKKTLGYLSAGDYDDAAEELLRGTAPGGISWYYHDVGARAEEISHMIRTGEWQ